MDLKFDADAVRALGRDAGRLAEVLAVEASGAETSLSEVSSSTGQEDVQTAVGELLRTLKSTHLGVVQGLRGFGAELAMTADAVEDADRKLAAKVPTE